MWMRVLALFCLLTLTTTTREHQTSHKQPWRSISSNDKCSLQEHVFSIAAGPAPPFCPLSIAQRRNAIYLLYDINPPEGFNLRRDVYIRLAVFVRQLQRRKLFQNVRLVLPPWRRLYHWKTSFLQQHSLPWQEFFDVESMRRYAPILDFPEFLAEIAQFGLQESPFVPVHQVFQLLHFEDMFEHGIFREKFEFERNCPKDHDLQGYLLQQSMLLDNDFTCVRFQGSVNLLERLLRHTLKHEQLGPDDVKVYAILNAEIVLHEHWGNRDFWRARRSMRFAAPLVAIADEYRSKVLNSKLADELVQRPPMWEAERAYRGAQGGAYLAVHFRRGDFVHGREKTTPTLKSAAIQIKRKLHELNLTTVFVATDALPLELVNLKGYLQRVRMRRFTPESLEQKAFIKDGGQAIIDQLICAHAQYFIGTYESTFTYRIYEEREILGFRKHTTFNTLCKSETLLNCETNSVWPIVY